MKKRSYSRRSRGVIQSIELLLILAAVIAIAMVVGYYLSNIAFKQASAKERLLSVSASEGFYFTTDYSKMWVTAHITNMGDREVFLKSLTVRLPGTNYVFSVSNINKVINAGETVTVTYKLSANRTPGSMPKYAILTIQYTVSGATGSITSPIVLTPLS